MKQGITDRLIMFLKNCDDSLSHKRFRQWEYLHQVFNYVLNSSIWYTKDCAFSRTKKPRFFFRSWACDSPTDSGGKHPGASSSGEFWKGSPSLDSTWLCIGWLSVSVWTVGNNLKSETSPFEWPRLLCTVLILVDKLLLFGLTVWSLQGSLSPPFYALLPSPRLATRWQSTVIYRLNRQNTDREAVSLKQFSVIRTWRALC